MRISFTAAVLLAQAVWITLVTLPDAHAQTAPDAGSLRQQIERERTTPLPPKAAPLESPAPAPLTLPDGATVVVREWRLADNTLLSDARLQPALQPYVGRALGFAELQQAAQAVARVYREAGWIVRTYLPRQDVTDGVITIQVIEALFAGARVEGAPSEGARDGARIDDAAKAAALPRIRPEQVVSIVDAQQKRGEPLNAAALDRALLLADDLPGVAVSGALEPGTRDRETALALRLQDEPLLSGNVTVDNGGTRSTGSARAGATASLAGPLRRGDLWRADVLHSQGSDYGRLAGSLPLGADGWRVGVNASRMDYRLIGDDFAALNGRGRSTSVGADVSYPLVRSRQRNVYLSFAYDQRRFHNEANGAVQSDYGVGVGTLALSANAFDELGGGGANTAGLAVQSGRVAQKAPDAGEDPALSGRFRKLRYSASRAQALGPRVSLYAALSGQHSGRNVDSSERFYLGGPSGVRAYPVNEGSGSRGNLLNLEVRYRVQDTLTVTGFYDAGRVSSPGAAGKTLKGAGVSLAWSGPHGLDVRLTWARRIGDNPTPTATGRDQDGSLVRNRLWLQVGFSF